MKDGFDKVLNQADSVESSLGLKIGSAEENLKALRKEFPRHLNILRGWLREDMQLARPFLYPGPEFIRNERKSAP